MLADIEGIVLAVQSNAFSSRAPDAETSTSIMGVRVGPPPKRAGGSVRLAARRFRAAKQRRAGQYVCRGREARRWHLAEVPRAIAACRNSSIRRDADDQTDQGELFHLDGMSVVGTWKTLQNLGRDLVFGRAERLASCKFWKEINIRGAHGSSIFQAVKLVGDNILSAIGLRRLQSVRRGSGSRQNLKGFFGQLKLAVRTSNKK